ncbi:MAG TPA: zf-HC2 domain-containing protein [Vicinamibacterales bacterium]|nr:zf-HC2 domain-containing protein [Vicinamibacterales bacterium]
MKKMTCRDVADFLGDYVSGELAGDLRTTFEDHLGRCVNCQRFLAQYRETIRVGRAAFVDPDADATTAVPEDLVRAILRVR